MFSPVEQERITRSRDAIPRHFAVIDSNNPLIFHEALSAEAVQFGIRIQRRWQIVPMHQILAIAVSPVNPSGIRRTELIKQMIPTLPLAKPVRIAHTVEGRHVVNGTVGI